MKKLIIGLTGGIGTGKTLALREFERLGARTVSLDGIARELSRKGTVAYRGIVKSFGRGILGASGEIDRARLAELVFARPRLRRRLEFLTHPGILREMERRIGRARGGVVVADVPLLFEAGRQRRFDLTLMVSASRRAQLRRVARRDGLSPAQVRRRISAQWPSGAKEALADVVISNDGSRKDLQSKIRQYYRAFRLMGASG